MDFKIFSSVLAALLAFALIVKVFQSIEQHRQERELERFLSTAGRPSSGKVSFDDALRRAREDRAKNEPSLSDQLRAARLQKESPDH